MTNEFKIPKLQSKNLNAATQICRDLKEEKCLSNKEFFNRLVSYRNDHSSHMHPKNFENIIMFLAGHGMVTKVEVNGLSLWVATQKCFRAYEENWFVIKQKVSLGQIKKAMAYQAINNGQLAFTMEAGIIAGNIFGLTGETKGEFITSYVSIMERLEYDGFMDEMARAITNSLNDIKTIDSVYIR